MRVHLFHFFVMIEKRSLDSHSHGRIHSRASSQGQDSVSDSFIIEPLSIISQIEIRDFNPFLYRHQLHDYASTIPALECFAHVTDIRINLHSMDVADMLTTLRDAIEDFRLYLSDADVVFSSPQHNSFDTHSISTLESMKSPKHDTLASSSGSLLPKNSPPAVGNPQTSPFVPSSSTKVHLTFSFSFSISSLTCSIGDGRVGDRAIFRILSAGLESSLEVVNF